MCEPITQLSFAVRAVCQPAAARYLCMDRLTILSLNSSLPIPRYILPKMVPNVEFEGGGVLTHTNGPCLLPSYDALNLTPTLHTILKFEAHTRTWPSTPEEINLLNKIAFDIKWQNPENKKVRYLSIVLRVLMLWNHIMLHTKIVITWHKWFQ